MIAVSPDAATLCTPVIPLVGCSVSSLGSAIGGSLGGDLAGSAARVAAEGLINAFTSYLASADAWLVGHIAGLYEAAPDLHGDWFRAAYESMGRAFEVVVTPVLLMATIGAILRQDLRRLGRIWAVGLPVAALAAASGVAFTDLGMRASDSLTAVVVGSHLDIRGALTSLSVNSVAAGSPVLVAMGVYGLALVGGVLVWLELILRSVAIYVAVFFLPLGLVTYVWPAAAGFARRSVEVLAALILSKFVIFSTLWLGASALAGGNTTDGILEGAGILLLASFTPFVLLKLLPVAGASAISHLEGMSRRPIRAASRAAGTAAAPSHPAVQRILAARGTSDSTIPETTPVSAQTLPTRAPDYVVCMDGSGDGD